VPVDGFWCMSKKLNRTPPFGKTASLEASGAKAANVYKHTKHEIKKSLKRSKNTSMEEDELLNYVFKDDPTETTGCVGVCAESVIRCDYSGCTRVRVKVM
jgi:hypothetical protein